MSSTARPIDEQVPFDPFAGPAIECTFPTTEAQREIWVAARPGDDASLAFNESIELTLSGQLDEAALRAAIQQLAARHEALRTTFSEDGLTGVVAAPATVDIALLDWSEKMDADERLAALRARVVTEPFDLVRGPLARFVLVRLSPREQTLFVTAHHIVCDGWSFGVIASELAALYNAARRDETPRLGEPERFSAYARSAGDEESFAAVHEAEQYWLGLYRDGVPVLDLPTDHQRPPFRSYRAEREDRTIPADLVKQVAYAGAQSGASLFAALFGGFGLLMHRLSGQNDLVVGVPSAGQAAAGLHGLVGHLVSMLPMRFKVDPTQRVRDLLGQARTAVLDGNEHQAMTFGSLLKQLPIARDSSRPSLVSVVFNLDRGLGADDLPFSGLAAQLKSVPRQYENFDVFLNAVQLDGAVTLECQYNADLFDRQTVRRWLDAYEMLLRGLAADIDGTISRISVVRESELTKLTHGVSIPLPTGRDLAVHRLFEAQAARTPDAVAVEAEDGSITYRELDARANQLAHHLRALGVKRGVLVGLCVERSLDLFVGLFGILKAGGAYVPLDPGYPLDRLNFMSADVGMTVLVSQERVHRETPLPAANVVLLDSHAQQIAAQPAAPLPTDDDLGYGDSPAYLIYTSGSTGKPNGVIVPHRAVYSLVRSVQDRPGMRANDVVLAISTLSFDIAVSEIICPLTVGARIVLATREVAADGVRLRDLIERAGVTFIDATPATYRLLFAAGWEGGKAMRVICTGEAMPRDLADALLEVVAEVWNGYGPTETTVWSTFWKAEKPLTRVLIGTPVANTVIYVLDERMEHAPLGAKGLLFIGGTGVTNGYLERPELTSHRFLPDPFSKVPGARMYRTGDVVRLLPDGNIEYLGRNDNQVKVRGYRIELGEIEDGLGKLASVRSAAVVARPDRSGELRLIAYIVAEGTTPPADSELRAHLKQSLPDYMVPATYVKLPKMPLTPSGKIDRKALPEPTAEDVVHDGEFVEPRTESEQVVAALWREALGLGRVSIRDDFFSLGGHSLLASQVLARLRRDHGVVLSFRKFFEAPTIERFAELVDREKNGAAPEAPAHSLRIPHREGVNSAPLSVIQERLWLLEELDPSHRATHNLPAAWRLRGPLDPAALESSIQEFVQRHDALRAGFHVVDGVRQQVVVTHAVAPIARVDVSGLPADQREAAINEYMLNDQETSFDVATPPLLRAAIITVDTDDHVLYTLRHAFVWDGWSFDIFIGEISERYRARIAGTAPELRPLAITYGDFAAWQREWLEGPDAQARIDWWREHLAGELPVLDMPTDRPRPRVSNYRGDRTYLTFTPDEVAAIRNFARAHDATLYTVLFAAYNALLYRYSGQSDLVVGSPAHARTWAETENVVGPFVNMLVLRTRITPSMSFTDLLAQVRETTLGALSRSEIPFEKIGGRPPVLRALFSMQDARTRPISAGPLTIQQVPEPQRYAANDMMLWTMESAVGMRAVLNYSSELFDRETADRFLRHLRTAVFSILGDASQSVDDIAIVPEEERALIAPPAAAEGVAPVDILTVVRNAAQRSGSALAVTTDSARLSYEALRQATRAVAGRLRALGAARGLRVAICTDSVAARAVAVLGALETGASVALLDPSDGAGYNDAVLGGQSFVALVNTRGVAVGRNGPVATLALSDDGRLADATGNGAEEIPELTPAALDAALVLHAPLTGGVASSVAVTHGTVARLLSDVADRLGLSSEDVVLSALPASADVAPFALLLSFVRGAHLALAHDDVVAEAEELSDLMTSSRATVGVATLATWRALVAAGWSADSRFRLVVADGALSGEEAKELFGTGARVFTCSTDLTTGLPYAVRELSELDEPALIGSVVGDVRAIVLDARRHPSPIGVWGDLYLGGPVVDALPVDDAAAADLSCIALGDDSSTLLRTGVVARRRADGVLEQRERVAAGAWIDGGRVRYRAVERVIAGHAAVAEVCVQAAQDAAGRARLVAYVVRRPGVELTDSEVRTAVRAQLPQRTVPPAVVELKALPRGASGEVIAAQLPSPFAGARPVARYVEPRNEAERVLAAAWSEMLGDERVSVTDNFFSLGGYSLLCFRVIDRVQRETGVRLSPRVLLLGTLEQAAAQLGQVAEATANGGHGGAGHGGTANTGEGEGAFKRFKSLLRGGK